MQEEKMSGEKYESGLYILGLPIGNVQDISLRVKNFLEQSPYIFCEDTRCMLKLCGSLGIKPKKLIALNAHKEQEKAQEVIALIKTGLAVGYASDAGMPAVSDPGSVLVSRVRQAGFEVFILPGVSAVTSLVAWSGIAYLPWTFHGFLPRSPQQIKSLFSSWQLDGQAHIFFESAQRLLSSLRILGECTSKEVFIGREMTKKFEQARLATCIEHIAYFSKHQDKLCGELSLLVPPMEQAAVDYEALASKMQPLLERQVPLKVICGIAGELLQNFSEKKLYNALLETKNR